MVVYRTAGFAVMVTVVFQEPSIVMIFIFQV